MQLWLLSQPHQSHVLKGFSVSALSGMRIIHTEVLARLLALVPPYLKLRGLCQQCLSWCRVCPYPVLIPLSGFLRVGPYTQPPQGSAQGSSKVGSFLGQIQPHNISNYPAVMNEMQETQ